MSATAKELGQLPVENQKWLEEGTAEHLAAETGDTSKLSPDNKRAIDYVMFKADEKAEEFGNGRQFTELREFRFWLRQDNKPGNGQLINPRGVYSGQPDRVRFYHGESFGTDVLLQEYKPGFEEAWDSWNSQVQAAAACIDSHLASVGLQVERVVTQIITRFHGVGELVLNRPALDNIRDRILIMLERQKDEQTTVNPGAWCNRCAGRLVCEASNAWLYRTQKQMFVELPAGNDGARWLEAALRVKKTASEIEEYYRHKLEQDSDYLNGEFSLKAGNTVRKIEDVVGAWSVLSGVISQEDFLSACKVGITELEESYVARLKAMLQLDGKKSSVKSLKESFNNTLGELLKFRENRASLEQRKKSLEIEQHE